MGRRLPDSRSLKRKGAKLSPKLTIYALCEGKNSEPEYLIGFCKIHGNGLVRIIPSRAQGVPSTIVASSIEKIKELEKAAKKSKDPLDSKFEVWAIFDCDDHPVIKESITRATQHKIKVGYSNPCFEIWALLHLDDHRQHLHRHPLQAKLKTKLPSYDPKTSKLICPYELNEHYDLAKKRAVNLMVEHKSVGSPKANPYTDVYKLLDKIKSNGIKKSA
jgi:hypothetical protein